MPKCKLPLDNTEKELGTWTTNFLIPNEGRYLGDLTITDKRIIFLSKFDTSLDSALKITFFETFEDEQYMIISRDKIKKIIPKKSMLNKRVTLQTDSDEEYIIDYGMLSINAIMDALEKPL